MASNTERGRLFQGKCREALELHFGKRFLAEVKIQIAENKWQSFDLATEANDIVAECKAFAFTASGNNPSAKITTLREAAQYLRAVPGSRARLLILKRDVHPTRGESLGAHFVRLNSYLLGDVTVLEIEETGGPIGCFHGTVRS